MSHIDELLQANRAFAAGFGYYNAYRPAPPAKQVAILTCMDARVQPERIFRLEIGDAHVIRNAGGRASDDALRSLVISSRLLGTREVMVIHHTECGLLSETNEGIRRRLREETGRDPGSVDFLVFTDLEQSVRDDVAAIRECPFISPQVDVRGFIYDVATGKVSSVDPQPTL